MSLGSRIKNIRENLGKTQKEMSTLMDVGLRTWQQYEEDFNNPSWKVVTRLSELGFSADWLATGEGEMKRGEGDHIVDANTMVAQESAGQAVDADPVTTVIVQELAVMPADQKRAVLKFCMDINGEQYTLTKYSSQENREKRMKG